MQFGNAACPRIGALSRESRLVWTKTDNCDSPSASEQQMNRPGSKLKPIAPKPPAQGGSAPAGSSTAAAHQAPAADAAGGQATGGSVAGAIVQATPGQHPTMQQHHPGQSVSPMPTASPYPGGPQPAFPGHGPPYALPFPVTNHSQPAYMMHPAGAPVSSHPGAPIIYPAGPQPMPASAPATASTQVNMNSWIVKWSNKMLLFIPQA